MKKERKKLPWELHDPSPDTPVCSRPLDLSDGPAPKAESVLPQPDEGPSAGL